VAFDGGGARASSSLADMDTSAAPRRITANGVDFAYLEAGPGDGPLVLCLHGFPDHAPTFRRLLPALAAEGYHAVAPWMRGYHPTSLAPDGRYQSATLALDAVALVEALSPTGTGAIVGHDWGATAACGAAVLAPDRVHHMAALAVPHPAVFAGHLVGDWEQRKRSWYMWFFQLATLPEMMVPAADWEFVRRLWQEWSPGYQPDPDDMARLEATLAAEGTLEAALGYYRQTIDFSRQADDLAAVQADVSGGRIAVPALFLAGAEDGCIDPALARASLEMCDGPAAAEILEGCGHFLHLERPDRVNALILRLLRDQLPDTDRTLLGRRA
jgi:pimeloyl-ACP methyl ester carboxylesterase